MVDSLAVTSVNEQCNKKFPVLIIAIQAAQNEAIRQLIKNGANIYDNQLKSLVLTGLQSNKSIVNLVIDQDEIIDIDGEFSVWDSSKTDASKNMGIFHSVENEDNYFKIVKKPAHLSERIDCQEMITDFDIYCSGEPSKPGKEEIQICQKSAKRVQRKRHRNGNVKKGAGCAHSRSNNEKRPSSLNTNLNVKTSAHGPMKKLHPQQRPWIGSMVSSTTKRREWKSFRSSRAKNHVKNSKHIKFKKQILRSRHDCKFSDGIKARKSTIARDHINTRYSDPFGRKISITKEVRAYAMKMNRKKERIKPKDHSLLRDESDSNVSPTQYFTKTDLFKYLIKERRFRLKPNNCEHHEKRPVILNQKAVFKNLACVRREKKSREPPDKLRPKMCFFMTRYMTSRKSRHNKKRFDAAAIDWKATKGMHEGGALGGSPQAVEVNSDDTDGDNWDAGALFHDHLVWTSTDILRAILQGSVDEIDMHAARTLASTPHNVYVTINVNRVDVQQAERLTVQNSPCVHVTNANFCVID